MQLCKIEKFGITDKQKLEAFAYRFYQYAQWEPKVGDYYTITRSDNQLCRIVGSTNDNFLVELSWPDGQVGNVTEFPKDGFNTKDFGINRMYVPTWIFKVEG